MKFVGVAKRILLRNWKIDIFPDVKEWLLEMCDISFGKQNIFNRSKEVA